MSKERRIAAVILIPQFIDVDTDTGEFVSAPYSLLVPGPGGQSRQHQFTLSAAEWRKGFDIIREANKLAPVQQEEENDPSPSHSHPHPHTPNGDHSPSLVPATIEE